MYSLRVESEVKTVPIIDTLAKDWKKFTKMANAFLFKKFGREGCGDDLVQDLARRFTVKRNRLVPGGFAASEEDATKIIVAMIKMYCNNPIYLTVSSDTARANSFNAKKHPELEKIIINSLDVIGATVSEDENIGEMSSSTNIDLKVSFIDAKGDAKEWDKYNDEGELSTDERLDCIRQLAPLFVSSSAAEQTAIIENIREMLNLSPETPDEYREILKTLLKNNH